jgi:hypothetical protein
MAVGRGSLSGRWAPRDDRAPNLRGAIVIEEPLPAGTKLWLSGWTKKVVAGEGSAEFISLAADIAIGGPRKR